VAAFADCAQAFADSRVIRPSLTAYDHIEGRSMRIYYPGLLMIPIMLLFLSALSVMGSFGIIQVARVWSLWPVTLIATGLEEVYLWTTTKKGR
jgi:hypothetical protein